MSLSAGTTEIGYWNTTFNSANLPDGNYNLSVNATDTGGNVNTSANISITIDNTPANISIDTPVNSTVQSASFLINASVNDTGSKIFNVTFRLTTTNTQTNWLYAELNSGTINQGYWNTTFDTTTTGDATYNITVNTTDFAGNQNLVNTTQITIDNNPPNNSIITPLANANISGNFLVNASVNDTGTGVQEVNLTLYNSTSNVTSNLMTLGSGTTTTGYWNATISTTTITDGRYNISINASDTSGKINISQNITITIDNTAANVSAITPANSTPQISNFLINVSVNDTLTKVFNVTFRLMNHNTVTDWLYAELNSGSIDQGYWNTTFNTNTTTDGNYNITINATDYAGNQNIINITQITIDTEPPTFLSLTNNASTTTPNNGASNWSITFADTIALANITFAFNDSGTFVFDETLAITGTSYEYNVTKTITTSTKGANVCGFFVFNDTALKQNTTSNSCLTVSNAAPKFNTSLEDQTVNSDATFRYDVNCTDIDGDPITHSDDTSLFNINSLTGLITDTPSESDVGAFTVTITCNDGTVNVQDSFIYTILDATKPTSNSLTNNASTITQPNGAVNWSVTLTDGVELLSYIFSFNDTGNFVNDTPLTISGTNIFINVSKTITADFGANVCGKFFFNDTSGNKESTENSCFTVKDAATNNPPTTPTTLHPTNNSYVNQQEIQLNASSSDQDLDPITYYHFINNTLNQTTVNANATLSATDAYYTYNVYAGDGINNSQNSTKIFFTKDTTPPTINYGQNTATNNTNTSQNWININVTANDLNENNITFNIYNTTTLITSATFTDKTRTRNFTNLNDSTYFYNVTITDLAGNTNTTPTRQITLDTTPPQHSQTANTT